MNRKKIVALIMVLALAFTTLVGGTLAYFTDTDDAVNVMTTGKVDISQNEQEIADGELEDFTQDKPLMPMYNEEEGLTFEEVDGESYFDKDVMNNVVDKIVTVKNEAKEGAINQDAYVRTILAFETNKEYKEGTTEVLRDGKEIFDTYIGTLGSFTLLSRDTIVVDGVEYVLAVKVYDEALAPQEVSAPSLKQIFMSPDANNEVAILFGEEYTILALSQGVQVAGFEEAGAKVALDEAFGDLETVEESVLIGWFETVINNH